MVPESHCLVFVCHRKKQNTTETIYNLTSEYNTHFYIIPHSIQEEQCLNISTNEDKKILYKKPPNLKNGPQTTAPLVATRTLQRLVVTIDYKLL